MYLISSPLPTGISFQISSQATPSPPDGYNRLCHSLKLCLIELLQKHSPDADFRKVEKVIDYIHENYHLTTLTNTEIAGHFNYHPYYLSNLMKQTTGKTLHQHLKHYRIRIAKNYLITTDLDINTISWKSGFHSAAYFIKTFREYTGVTPKVYRQKHLYLLL